jgi:glycerophosphoryl diester phosphodiesterase
MKLLISLGMISSLLFAMSHNALHATEIIAHRGASYDAPENTMSSVCLGWEQQADAVEIDIFLSKDNQIVLSHDDNTRRTGGVDKKVVDQTLTELRQLDFGSWKAPQYAGEKIATLDEVIQTIPNGKRLVIEVKCGPEVIPMLKECLAKSGKKKEQFLIIGFSHPTMKEIKKALPSIEAYWLSSFTKNAADAFFPTTNELIRKAKEAGVEGLNLSIKGPVDAALVQQVKAAGLKCYAWTVDSPEVAQRLVAAGVDGITTNRPLWLRQQLAAGANDLNVPVR